MGVTPTAIRVYYPALSIFKNFHLSGKWAPVVRTHVPSPIKHPPVVAIFRRLYLTLQGEWYKTNKLRSHALEKETMVFSCPDTHLHHIVVGKGYNYTD